MSKEKKEDDNTLLNVFILFFVSAFLIICMVIFIPAAFHDDPIIDTHFENAKIQYFIESDNNMPNKEKYNLMETICTEKMGNNALNDELWYDFMTDETLRIEKCKKLLMESD